MNALAERLRACREKLHLSQEYVANYMDMGRATVTQIELGNRKVTAEELAQFSILYGLSCDELLLGGQTHPTTKLTEGFYELDEKDQEEIMHLIQFKKMMKNKRLK